MIGLLMGFLTEWLSECQAVLIDIGLFTKQTASNVQSYREHSGVSKLQDGVTHVIYKMG